MWDTNNFLECNYVWRHSGGEGRRDEGMREEGGRWRAIMAVARVTGELWSKRAGRGERAEKGWGKLRVKEGSINDSDAESAASDKGQGETVRCSAREGAQVHLHREGLKAPAFPGEEFECGTEEGGEKKDK